MYSDYWSFAKTKEEEEVLLEELSMLYESLYKSDRNAFEETLNSKVRSEVAALIRQKIKTDDKTMFLKDLISRIKGRKVVKMTLAIAPTDFLIGQIYNWLITSISENIVLDISIDKQILGGAIVSFGGKYFDFTLRKTLDQLGSNNFS